MIFAALRRKPRYVASKASHYAARSTGRPEHLVLGIDRLRTEYARAIQLVLLARRGFLTESESRFPA